MAAEREGERAAEGKGCVLLKAKRLSKWHADRWKALARVVARVGHSGVGTGHCRRVRLAAINTSGQAAVLAGWSVLGGPLLTRLLSAESIQDVATRFSRELFFAELNGQVANKVRPFYWAGLSDDALLPVGRRAQERLWANAEEFLDILDTAAENPDPANPLARRLDTFGSHHGNYRGELSALRGAARRLIAAECAAFLKDAPSAGERWDPYWRWQSDLVGKSDTILTFNYDPLLETLHLLPTDILEDAPIGRTGDTSVLKLHGSIDWAATEQQGIWRSKDPYFALDAKNEKSIVLGTPGTSKKNTIMKVLKPLWDLGEAALRAADAIVFVGYRFPETDAHARQRLLGAIRANKGDPNGKRTVLPIHIVLGGSVESTRHAQRSASMLRFVCSAASRRDWASLPSNPTTGPLDKDSRNLFRIFEHPLFAQDFFSVVEREDIFRER